MIVRERYPKIKSILGVTSLQTAADDNLIVTTADMKVGAYTVAAQPTSPSKLEFKVTTVGDADTMGTIKIVGTDIHSAALEETITPVSGSTVSTTRAFRTVTSITGAGWVVSADTSADTIIVGIPATGALEVRGSECMLLCKTGIIYFNPNAVATAAAASFQLIAGQQFSLCVDDILSIISDGNAATFEFVIYDN